MFRRFKRRCQRALMFYTREELLMVLARPERDEGHSALYPQGALVFANCHNCHCLHTALQRGPIGFNTRDACMPCAPQQSCHRFSKLGSCNHPAHVHHACEPHSHVTVSCGGLSHAPQRQGPWEPSAAYARSQALCIRRPPSPSRSTWQRRPHHILPHTLQGPQG